MTDIRPSVMADIFRLQEVERALPGGDELEARALREARAEVGEEGHDDGELRGVERRRVERHDPLDDAGDVAADEARARRGVQQVREHRAERRQVQRS